MSCDCCDDRTKRKYYRYYDTPDGCDVDKKVMVAARYGVIAGLVLGTYDVLMYTHAVGLGPIMRRYGRHVLPLGMMGATFAVVANGAQHYREQDDGLNYFLGGIVCGPLAAWYLRSKHAILLGGLALGAIAYIKKDAIDHCVPIFPDIPGHFNTVNGWRNDWTIASDPKICLLCFTPFVPILCQSHPFNPDVLCDVIRPSSWWCASQALRTEEAYTQQWVDTG